MRLTDNRKKVWVPLALTAIALVLLLALTFFLFNRLGGPDPHELNREEMTEEEYERARELQKQIKREDPLGKRQNVIRKINPRLETGLVFDDAKKLNKGNLIEVMHRMTHQKISATRKDGAIPMTHENIQVVREYLELLRQKDKVKLEDYQELDRIVVRWEQAEFDEIDKEQDYLLEEMLATIGFSNGLATKAEEELFILNNFGEEYTYTMELEPVPGE